MNDYINVELIKNFIDNSSVTVYDFCISCDIEYATLEKLYNNRTDVSFDDLIRISILMEIGVHELIKPQPRKPRPGFTKLPPLDLNLRFD